MLQVHQLWNKLRSAKAALQNATFFLPECFVTINQWQRTVNMQMCYLTYYRKISWGTSNKYTGLADMKEKKGLAILQLHVYKNNQKISMCNQTTVTFLSITWLHFNHTILCLWKAYSYHLEIHICAFESQKHSKRHRLVWLKCNHIIDKKSNCSLITST